MSFEPIGVFVAEVHKAAGMMPVLASCRERGGVSLVPFFPFATERGRARCLANHDQSPERLRERGGLAPSEMLHILLDVPWGADLGGFYGGREGREAAMDAVLEWLGRWGWRP